MIVPYLTENQVHEARFARGTSYYLTERGHHADGRSVRAETGQIPVPGFGVRVGRRSKTYVLRHRGKPHTLGRADLISLQEARTRARVKYLEILEGSPRPETAARQKKLVDLYREFKAIQMGALRAGDLHPRTLKQYQHLWSKHLLSRWEFAPLSSITVEELERWKREMAGRPVAFNRALQQLSAAFALAVRLKWAPENPCEAVESFGERPAARMLTEEEIVSWARSLDLLELENEVSQSVAAALRALFYSGARPGEILGARKEWADEVPGESQPLLRIHLPAAKGDRKGGGPRGRTIRVPPPASTSLILASLDHDGPKLVDASMKQLRTGFDRVCRQAGIEGATPKVLRHVWRSVAPEAGVDPDHTRQLGGWSSHRVPNSVYTHDRDRALDEGALRIARRLEEVSSGDEKAEADRQVP